MAAWRSEVDARGVVVVVPPEGTSAAEIGGLANRILDAGFNHAYVEGSERPLALRIAVASMLAGEKLLGHRQRMEQGRPSKPTITALWLDERGPDRAIEVLRAQPPPRVQAVIVLTKGGASQRSTIAGPAGEIRVLKLAAPADGPISEAAWAEALGFLAAVERDLVGGPGERGEGDPRQGAKAASRGRL
ncbi:MAG: hypothetical protein H6711_32735 [Myxococcales bacterium]|nr:hypothetical protein [Myxococcales bacterium]